MATSVPKRGFDTGAEQYAGGNKYDPRKQWGNGPWSGFTVTYPDLPMGGFNMTGQEIALAGPRSQYSGIDASGQLIRKKKELPSEAAKAKHKPALMNAGASEMTEITPAVPVPERKALNPEKIAMEKLAQGLYESNRVQGDLLAKRYLPGNRFA